MIPYLTTPKWYLRHTLVPGYTDDFPRFENLHRINTLNSVTGNKGIDFCIHCDS